MRKGIILDPQKIKASKKRGKKYQESMIVELDDFHDNKSSFISSWKQTHLINLKIMSNIIDHILSHDWESGQYKKFPVRDVFSDIHRKCLDLTERLNSLKSIAQNEYSIFLDPINQEISDLKEEFVFVQGFVAAVGSIPFDMALKDFHDLRTEKSTTQLRKKRKIKELLVQEAYLKWLKQNPNREIIKFMSERKMAQTIKKLVETDLGANGIKSISEQTIIDILRNRNMDRLPFYPWKSEGASKA